MNDKTRLEKELERVQNQGRRWKGFVVLLVVLLLLAALYIGALHRRLYEAREEVKSLRLRIDTLEIEAEALKVDVLRCSSAEGAPPAEGGGEASSELGEDLDGQSP